MFRAIRRRIRMIRYYSASRPGTRWSRARDISLVVSIGLAVVAVYLANIAVTRSHARENIYGRVMTTAGGFTKVLLVDEEYRSTPWAGNVTPVSEFELKVIVEDRGWPVTTSRVIRAPQLDIKELAAANPKVDVAYDENDATARAIVAALESDERSALAREWMKGQAQRTTLPLGWIFGITLWMIMLWIACMIAIVGLRLIVFSISAKKQIQGARHRAQGHCVHCGYDLHGLEFQERCPECGNLAW